jgi:hypothetical protein
MHHERATSLSVKGENFRKRTGHQKIEPVLCELTNHSRISIQTFSKSSVRDVQKRHKLPRLEQLENGCSLLRVRVDLSRIVTARAKKHDITRPRFSGIC